MEEFTKKNDDEINKDKFENLKADYSAELLDELLDQMEGDFKDEQLAKLRHSN